MAGVVVLGTREPTTYLLINQLLDAFDVEFVVFEHHSLSKQLSLLRRRARRLGPWRVFNQLLFMVWDRLYLGPTAAGPNEQRLKGHDLRPPDGRVTTLDVPDINAPAVLSALAPVEAPCAVISGTSIVRDPLLHRFPVLLNIHCGITPRYRGVHGAFWAIYDGRPDLAGVTVHRVDAGIDTGAIVSQEAIRVCPSDDYRTLPVKQYLAGAPLMVAAVRAALDGALTARPRTDLESKLWSTPTIPQYLRFRRQLRAATEA
jgi:hypothetical protein